MFVLEAMERIINRPRQDGEPQVIVVMYVRHHARDRSCHALYLRRSQCWKLSEAVSRRYEVECGRIVPSCDACRGSFNRRTETCQTILADEASPVMAPPLRRKKCKDSRTQLVRAQIRGCEVQDHTGVQSVYIYFQRSQVEQRCIAANAHRGSVEVVAQDRMRAFLDRHARRPAPVLTGGGSAEPAVVEPALIQFGAASSTSSGGALPSSMETATGGAEEGTFKWFSANIGRHP